MPGKRINRLKNIIANPSIASRMIILLVVVISFSVNFSANRENFWKEVVASDGRGYYAYLPSFILYGEAGFDHVLTYEKTKYPMMAGNFLSDIDGKPVSRYLIGVALLILPFFLVAILLSLIAGLPVDGYNSVFQLMVSVSGILYLYLGLLFTRRFLKQFEISDKITVFSLFVIVFGTNQLVYTVDAPAMSHVYSFAVVAGFLAFSGSFMIRGKNTDAIVASFFLGMVVLIRPVNATVILLIPFLANNFREFVFVLWRFITNHTVLLLSLLVFIILVSFQPFVWYIQTGKWLVWSYQGEGFYFTDPQVMKFLFSYQKGFFIYTPVALLAVPGIIMLFIHNSYRALFLLLFLVITAWIGASWWNWYYGDSFGQRVLIDFYSVLALLLAITMKHAGKRMKIPLYLLVFLLIGLNLVQTWQYSKGIIHPYAMTREKYWYSFLRTGESYRNIFGGPVDLPPYKTDLSRPLCSWNNDFETELPGWVTSGITQVPEARSGNHVSTLQPEQQYSSALLLTADTDFIKRRDLYVKTSFFLLEKQIGTSDKTSFVISMTDSTENIIYWHSYRVNEMPVDTCGYWRSVEFGFSIPEIKRANDRLKLFVWHQGEGMLYIDDLSISLFGRQKAGL